MNTSDLQSPGRVNLNAPIDPDVAHLPGFSYPKTAPSNAGQDGIRGNVSATPLNQAFFSSQNFQIVQNQIRHQVFQESGDVIDPVSTDDLFMIMRAQYLQYGRNLPDNIPEQIAELNARVSAWSVPKILAELAMYKTYMKDIDTLPIPIAQPTYISEAGTRSKPMPQWF
jgi:hypothetical protein